MIERFAPEIRRSIEIANAAVISRSQSLLDTLHLLLGSIEVEGTAFRMLNEVTEVELLAREVQELLDQSQQEVSQLTRPRFSPEVLHVLHLGWRFSQHLGADSIGSEHVLFTLVTHAVQTRSAVGQLPSFRDYRFYSLAYSMLWFGQVDAPATRLLSSACTLNSSRMRVVRELTRKFSALLRVHKAWQRTVEDFELLQGSTNLDLSNLVHVIRLLAVGAVDSAQDEFVLDALEMNTRVLRRLSNHAQVKGSPDDTLNKIEGMLDLNVECAELMQRILQIQAVPISSLECESYYQMILHWISSPASGISTRRCDE
jgi:hypothetical protein